MIYKPGKFRPYTPSDPSPTVISLTHRTKFDHFLITLLLSLSILIRLYKLYSPSRIIFDEVHFGRFAREYFHGQFFVDVHPPLGKLIYYWISLLFSWDGEFQFDRIADAYPSTVPYVAMRMFPALSGVGTVMLTFGILRSSGCRSIVAFFGAILVLVENSLVTQSRAILLDSPMIFGMALTIYSMKRFQLEKPFGRKWYKYLALVGFSLGITTSIKLTGLYTAFWVGIITVCQLWKILGDLEVSDGTWFKHVGVRLFSMVVIPLSFYLSIFAVHFISLPFHGSGSGMISSTFKSTFVDSELSNQPVDVSYGSTVTIKHNQLEGYLHSHDHEYLSGSHEQQITMYGFDQDEGNEWIIETKHKTREGELQKKFKPVKDGDIIRLYHKSTGKFLRVNDVRPPVSEHDYCNEVSCHSSREELLADANYEFKVKILSSKPHSTSQLPLRKLRATESIFQLSHRGTKCELISHTDKLPDWGFNQNEVLCVNEPTISNTLWYIEENSHPVFDDDESYPRVVFGNVSFWKKLVEYHQTMIRFNNGLTENHDYQSSPGSWPFLLRGVNYYSNEGSVKELGEDPSHIYYLGNVFIYYAGWVLIMLGGVYSLGRIIRFLNPFSLLQEPVIDTLYYQNTIEYLLGWFLHYYPAFHMSRQLFLHHYLPALYFSILLVSQYIEYQISKRKYAGYLMMIVMLGGSIYCFVEFIPLIYGTNWTTAACNRAKWFGSWDFNCMTYSE
jgi:Dolichyl-phosphate-mannose--protein O-mannosyl transferase